MKHVLLTTAALAALSLSPFAARADALVDEAKAAMAKATAHADVWDGPTSGPKSAGRKSVVYVAGDMRNAKGAETTSAFIFFLTFSANNLIYESHCDFRIAKF